MPTLFTSLPWVGIVFKMAFDVFIIHVAKLEKKTAKGKADSGVYGLI
jgi:hypothetical protein